MQEIERDVENAAVDVERGIGCALRVVFWTLFVVYTVVLAVAGWALYTYVLAKHPIEFGNHNNAVLVGLAVVLLGTMLAAITRDQLIDRIFHRVRKRQKK